MLRSVIFGAAGELGSAIAASLRARGDRIALLDLDAMAPCGRAGDWMGKANLSSDRSVAEALTGARAHLGGIDVVVNAAGIVSRSRIEDLEAQEFARVLDVNLVGAFRVTKAASEMMSAGGAIVHLSSCHGQRGGPGRAAYAASKGGLEAFIRAAATELGPRSITINAVAPGPTGRGMGNRNPARDVFVAAAPMRRAGEGRDVAEAVAFLTGPCAHYITGHVLPLDGGASATSDLSMFAVRS
ncbi:SDR family oxidoreductase [Stappia sp. MMSF_3263]|uniref:SDR family oxidoreductase n=1 Tax=Stappia sp. MMSF_3263 TaxID=3046693 RepID=UPI00273D3F9A|nr:SDR family oxidoreductase [Stappia sp. MMSF_3263]